MGVIPYCFYVIHTEHIHAYDYYYYTIYGVRLVVGGWVDQGTGRLVRGTCVWVGVSYKYCMDYYICLNLITTTVFCTLSILYTLLYARRTPLHWLMAASGTSSVGCGRPQSIYDY